MNMEKRVEGKDKSGSETFQQTTRASDEKFVPTCSICGEKHWPHHPLVPCVNKKKAKAKAKAEAKAEKKGKGQGKRKSHGKSRSQGRRKGQ